MEPCDRRDSSETESRSAKMTLTETETDDLYKEYKTDYTRNRKETTVKRGWPHGPMSGPPFYTGRCGLNLSAPNIKRSGVTYPGRQFPSGSGLKTTWLVAARPAWAVFCAHFTNIVNKT